MKVRLGTIDVSDDALVGIGEGTRAKRKQVWEAAGVLVASWLDEMERAGQNAELQQLREERAEAARKLQEMETEIERERARLKSLDSQINGS